MTMQEPISPELQEKIDALPDEKLRNDILFMLGGPGKRTATNEQIFNNLIAGYLDATAQRTQRRQWRDDEVQSFVEYFKQESPEDYAEYFRQEREHHEIDSDLSWRVGRLIDQLIPGLTYADNGSMRGKFRDYVQANLEEIRSDAP